jgi:tripartite-type tricarboxylate transporter receptor subunit TctC
MSICDFAGDRKARAAVAPSRFGKVVDSILLSRRHNQSGAVTMKVRRLALAVAALVIDITSAVSADEARWPSPNQVIKFIVPTSPGGNTDLFARLVAERLHEKLGATFIVDNRAGGAGNIGTELVNHARPDGATFLFTQSAHTTNVAFFKNSYDPIKDFVPIALIGTSAFMLCVNAGSPVMSLHDLLDLVRVKGDKMTYASAGFGTSHHLAMKLLLSMTNLDMTHVPYNGTTPAVAALLAGQIDTGVGTDSSMVQYVQAGRVRCLAATGSSRSPLFPDVPTIAEAVPLPGYEIDTWYGLLGPVGLPRPIIDVINHEVNRIVIDPEFVTKHLTPAGIVAAPTTPELFMERLQAEVAEYLKIAAEAKVTKE